MADDGSATVRDLVRDVKKAIQHVQEQLDEHDLIISNVDLEIKTTLTRSGGGEFKLSIIPLDLSGHYTETDIQTIKLSMVPRESAVELLGSVQDELAKAINIIGATIEEAASSEPVFDLSETTITLNFGVTTDGKISIIASAGGERERTHTVQLTLRKRSISG